MAHIPVIIEFFGDLSDGVGTGSSAFLDEKTLTKLIRVNRRSSFPTPF